MDFMNITEKENVIFVTGYGRLFVEPNYINISISIGCRSNSMKISLEGVNADMKQLFEIIAHYKVDESLVHVVDLSLSPKYEWKKEVHEFLGYDVDQKVNIEMDATKENQDKAQKIIGEITSLKFLNDCDIEYGLKKKKEFLEKVRKLSFENAVEKAEQYAKLAGVRIIKANTIIDQDAVGEHTRHSSNFMEDAICESESDSYLPNGRKIVLENRVHVTFDIDK
jgi:uncharacterized protein YggE